MLTFTTEHVRRAAFAELVASQDKGYSVERSRAFVCRKYTLSEEEIKGLEREGIERQWPPLG